MFQEWENPGSECRAEFSEEADNVNGKESDEEEDNYLSDFVFFFRPKTPH